MPAGSCALCPVQVGPSLPTHGGPGKARETCGERGSGYARKQTAPVIARPALALSACGSKPAKGQGECGRVWRSRWGALHVITECLSVG